jgi:hypothetical protein
MTPSAIIAGQTSWTRMSEGIEKVKARLRRATGLLEAAAGSRWFWMALERRRGMAST